MPLKRCTSDGKSGWKWGDSGKCYTGPGARQKAIKQGRAIEANNSRVESLLRDIAKVLDGKKK